MMQGPITTGKQKMPVAFCNEFGNKYCQLINGVRKVCLKRDLVMQKFLFPIMPMRAAARIIIYYNAPGMLCRH